jgi:hypothetical protein
MTPGIAGAGEQHQKVMKFKVPIGIEPGHGSIRSYGLRVPCTTG